MAMMHDGGHGHRHITDDGSGGPYDGRNADFDPPPAD
jgi:hypothetical protein